MSTTPSLEIEIRSDPCELLGVRDRVRRWTVANGWSETQVSEIVLAIDEAISNVIEHAYDGSLDHPIQLSMRTVPVEEDPRGGAEIRIRDFGRQVDPECIRSRPLDEVRDGGLGVYLIQSMMSSVEYTPANDRGMILLLRKHKDHTAKVPGCSSETP